MNKLVLVAVLVFAFAIPARARTDGGFEPKGHLSLGNCTICATYRDAGLLEALAAHCETGRHDIVEEPANAIKPEGDGIPSDEYTLGEPASRILAVTPSEDAGQAIKEIIPVVVPVEDILGAGEVTLSETIKLNPVINVDRIEIVTNLPPGLVLFNNRIIGGGCTYTDTGPVEASLDQSLPIPEGIEEYLEPNRKRLLYR